jgi:hypothetical protein
MPEFSNSQIFKFPPSTVFNEKPKDVHLKFTILLKIGCPATAYFFWQFFCCSFVRPLKFFSYNVFIPRSIFFDVKVPKAGFLLLAAMFFC